MSNDTPSARLLYAHDTVYMTEGWIQPLLPTLQSISATDAAWKANDETKSIWEIVAHLTNYTEDLATDLRGVEIPKFEDWPDVTDTSDAEWQKLLGRLESSVSSLASTIKGLTPEELATPPVGMDTPRWERIVDILIHNAYHAGQVYQLAGLRTNLGKRLAAAAL